MGDRAGSSPVIRITRKNIGDYHLKKADGSKPKKFQASKIGMICGLISVVVTVGVYFYIGFAVSKINPDIDLLSYSWYKISILVTAVFLNLLGFFVSIVSRDVEVKDEEERETSIDQVRKLLSDQTNLNSSFSAFFYFIAVVDLDADFFYSIINEELINELVGEKGRYSIAVKTLINRTIEENKRNELYDFFDIDNIKFKLMSTDTLVIEFINEFSGWSRTTIVPIEKYENGEPKIVMMGFQKINELKTKELQMQESLESALQAANTANDAKSAFLSKMSHDIRTPLNGMMGMAALAGTRIDDTERVQYCLNKIEDAGKHLISIIDEVLDMSRIESGRMELKNEEFSLSVLMDNMITMIHPMTDKKHQDLIVDVMHVEHEMVVGDSTRLQEVFLNLTTNAVKYTEENGTIKISLSERYRKKDTACFEFVVEDNGIGMTKEYMQHLFEPFIRDSSDKVKNVQGTGLGLPIAKSIITMMDGDLTAESEEGKGSRFKATFYLKLQEEAVLDVSSLKGKRILLVDDNERALKINKELIESLGMIVDSASGGPEGKALFKESLEDNIFYDAAIIDWKMPELDGFKLAQYIINELRINAPVIALAAYDWSEIELEANRCGIMTFISKPFFRSRVIEALYKMLAGASVAEPVQETHGIKIAENDFTGKCALLVEDNDLNREIAKELLEMAHLSVETAADGAIAVDMVKQNGAAHYDIIFMDIQMPNMNGYEASSAIRKLPDDAASTVPIIAMSADAFLNDIKKSGESGMNEHISKPIDMQRLNDVMVKYLS